MSGSDKFDNPQLKERWQYYQNDELTGIKDLTPEQLQKRIEDWEEVVFEARSRQQKCLALQREQKIAAQKSARDSLITKPDFKPSDNKDKPRVKHTKEDKLKESLANLGVDLGEILNDINLKKTKSVRDSMNGDKS